MNRFIEMTSLALITGALVPAVALLAAMLGICDPFSIEIGKWKILIPSLKIGKPIHVLPSTNSLMSQTDWSSLKTATTAASVVVVLAIGQSASIIADKDSFKAGSTAIFDLIDLPIGKSNA